MMKQFLFLFACTIAYFGSAQNYQLYSPQINYDSPGGLYDESNLRTINVQFLDTGYHTILADAFLNNPTLRLPATITVDGVAYDSAGVRYKGNSTFCLPNDNGVPKVPYNIDMNYWKSGQKLEGYKKIKLANAWLDATYVREITASNIYRKYLPSIEANFMKLNVQGDYLGLYVNTEAINRQFLEKHFNERNGPLFKCDNANVFCGPNVPDAYQPNLSFHDLDSATYYNTYTIKSDHGWQALLDLIKTLKYDPSKLDTIMNIDRVLWAFAVNTVIANYDTYNGYYIHNYYLFQTNDGLFQMIPWDLSESYLNALLGFDIFTDPQGPLEYNPYFGENPLDNRPLAAYLLNNPLYRKIFTAHINTVMDELDLNALSNEITDLQALCYDAANDDPNSLMNMTQFTNNVQNNVNVWAMGGFGLGGIFSTLNGRLTYLQGHPEISLSAPMIDTVLLSDEGYLTATVQNVDSVEVLVTTNKYNSKFEAFSMKDDGTNGDVTAGDGIFTAPLPYFFGDKAVKFYVRAHNSDAVKLSPERAEYEFYFHAPIPPEEPSLDPYLLVYPNPVQNTLFVASNLEYPLEYQLYSSLGQVLEDGMIDSELHQINVSSIASELIFLRVNNEVFKIIKSN